MKSALRKYFVFFILLTASGFLYGQKITRVRGQVLDAKTGKPIPFAAVTFKNKNIGSITDYSGNFSIESNFATDAIVISSLGYESTEMPITLYNNNYSIKIRLRPTQVQLESVDIVTTKKKRYKNKGNPAVMLIREVVKHRKGNRMKDLDSYSMDKYKKIEIDLNNITQKFMSNAMFKNFQEIFNYVDTSKINGKPFLPVFLNEIISKVYYQRDSNKKKEWIIANRTAGFDEYLDGEGASAFILNILQEVDIYSGSILFLEKDFTSPIANIAPSIYRYYLLDTVMIDNISCYEMGFMPRNNAAFAFKGKLWIVADSTYAIKQVELGMTDQINVNFVNTFLISQKFSRIDSAGMILTESHTTIDFDVAMSSEGTGLYAKKSEYFENFEYNIIIPDTILKVNENIVKTPGCLDRDSVYWDEHRLMNLTESEKEIDVMSDYIQKNPSFRVLMNVVDLLLSGYYDKGPIGIGPIGSIYSFNQIEGFRVGIGLRTTEKFNKNWELGANIAYGFKDKGWKYGGQVKYYWDRKKKNYIKVQYKHDYRFPGATLDFVRSDNFFVSFQRGEQDKMVNYYFVDLEYSHEFSNAYQLIFSTKTGKESGLGNLNFLYENQGELMEIKQFNTYEIGVRQRFSPNQKYYTGKNSRSVIITNHPIYEITYKYGQSIDRSFPFSYNKLNLRFFKRTPVGIFGYNDILIEAEKTFGSGIPFLYLRMHAANQTYTFQEYSANMMNYLEFVSDQYVYLIFTQYFDGLIFNTIPLIKRLKWRSLVSFRALYGGVTKGNDPNQTPGLIEFPKDSNGDPTTFSLDQKPYFEASVGIENIFHLLRIDLVKRFSYLDNPDIPVFAGLKGVGIRFKIRINF